MNDSVKKQKQRTLQYWYVDGLSEMASGFIFLLLALTFWIVHKLPGSLLSGLMAGVGQPLIIILGLLFASRVVRRIKENLTYPRTGYVSYRNRHGKRRWLSMVITILVSATFAVITVLVMQYLGEIKIIIFVGLLVALSKIFIAYRVGLLRFYISAGLTFVLALLLAWFYPGSYAVYYLFFLGMGTIWLISGLVTLLKYLRDTKEQEVLDE